MIFYLGAVFVVALFLIKTSPLVFLKKFTWGASEITESFLAVYVCKNVHRAFGFFVGLGLGSQTWIRSVTAEYIGLLSSATPE